MSRYVIQFYKEGTMRYISHLDLLRLFKRTFKRTGIKLIYSKGFNPHPKMSFVQPLSLGYEGRSEYLDFETVGQPDGMEITSLLNAAMPKGVGVINCRRLPLSKRTLAAIVDCGLYDISMEIEEPSVNWHEKISGFLEQDEIIVSKKQKKTGKMVDVNIRPMIHTLTLAEPAENKEVCDKNITLTCLMAAGSNCNLNPEVMLNAFCKYCGIDCDTDSVAVIRRELYFTEPDTGKQLPILECDPTFGGTEEIS